MKYKTTEDAKKGDAVIGKILGEPAAGNVIALNEKKETIIVQRRGKAQLDPKSRQMYQGQLEQHEVDPKDFSLVYRKEA